MGKSLEEMAAAPCPDRGYRSVALANYTQIVQARQNLWTWAEIADSLGLQGKERALGQAFSRVRKQVEAGKLKPPSTTGGRRSGKTSDVKSNFINLDSL